MESCPLQKAHCKHSPPKNHNLSILSNIVQYCTAKCHLVPSTMSYIWLNFLYIHIMTSTNTVHGSPCWHFPHASPSLPSGHNLARRKKGTIHGDDAIPRDDVIYVVDLVEIPRWKQAARGWINEGGKELGWN